MNYILYKPVKYQTSIKGYWIDKGKVYIDSIELVSCKNTDILKESITELFNNGELAVFYTQGNKGYIQSKEGNTQELNKRLQFQHIKSIDNVKCIKDIIQQYRGCTVYDKKGHIIIEVYTNE